MSEPVLRITYWGVTGTLSAPLRPEEVTEKLTRAIELLAREGRLNDLCPEGDLRAQIEQRIATLPFHLRSTFGGNTTCVEVETPDALLILDCGSGFRELGREIQRRWNAPDFQGERKAEVLITHPHMDHSFATPYFAPYFDSQNSFRIWASEIVLESLRILMDPNGQMRSIYFPPTFEMTKGIKELKAITPGGEIQLGETCIKTLPLNHPGGCLAFRIEHGGRSFVFATDHEQVVVPDPGLVTFAKDADLLYTEGQFTEAEYEGKEPVGDATMSRRGWGHSTIEACVKSAVAAGVKRLHVGHHDPARTDEEIAKMEARCQQLYQKLIAPLQPEHGETEVLIPYEGMTVEI